MMAMASVTIDTSALRHNLSKVREYAPQAKVMAVVKANAYGHGLNVVGRALEAADALAVARVEEGLELRAAGILKPVVLLEGVFDKEQLQVAARARFELVVHSPQQIELLRAAPTYAHFPIWLKADTGMNRLGFKEAEFVAAHAALSTLPSVEQPFRLFTHMASADDATGDATRAQLAKFAALAAPFGGERSAANSAALIGAQGSHFDWVRPGLMLYGVSPFAGSTGADMGLRPAMTFSARVIAVKDLRQGERVGYGGVWTAQRQSRIAIASAGYGDGYPRSARSDTPVLVAGRRAKLAGRVSMDMIAIDITEIEATVYPGDAVTLWGEGLPIEEIATWAARIPYELMCAVTQRVRHVGR
jgi:alanine racemase